MMASPKTTPNQHILCASFTNMSKFMLKLHCSLGCTPVLDQCFRLLINASIAFGAYFLFNAGNHEVCEA